MKTATRTTRYLFALLLALPAYQHAAAQPPLPIHVPERIFSDPEHARLGIFGLRLSNPTLVEVGPCPGEVITGPGIENSDNFITAIFPYDTCPNGANDPVRVCTAAGCGQTQILVEIPAPALPVELATFEGRLDGGAVALHWATLSESNNQGFAVQRQPIDLEGAPWTTLGFVDGAGTSHEAHSYSFRDEALPPNTETVRYRLKQVDLDGTWAYSSVVEVAVPNGMELTLESIYPNPAQGAFTVRFTVPEHQTEAASLELYDMLGRRVRVLTAAVGTARNELTVPVEGLAAGLYLLRLKAGGTVHTRPVGLAR